MIELAGKFAFEAFGLSLNADGLIGLLLALPVACVIVATAWRIGRSPPPQ